MKSDMTPADLTDASSRYTISGEELVSEWMVWMDGWIDLYIFVFVFLVLHCIVSCCCISPPFSPPPFLPVCCDYCLLYRQGCLRIRVRIRSVGLIVRVQIGAFENGGDACW